MPSVLVETGFISNSKEEQYLLSDEGQSYLASAIYRAFRDYKKWYDELNAMPEDVAQSSEIKNESGEKQIVNDLISFKIQISSASKPIPLNSDYFKGLQNVQEIKYQGLYKYAVGNENDFNEIVKLKEKLKNDFPDAFIIAMQNGKIIPLNQALKEIKKN